MATFKKMRAFFRLLIFLFACSSFSLAATEQKTVFSVSVENTASLTEKNTGTFLPATAALYTSIAVRNEKGTDFRLHQTGFPAIPGIASTPGTFSSTIFYSEQNSSFQQKRSRFLLSCCFRC